MSIQDIYEATQNNIYIQELNKYITRGWPADRNEVNQDSRAYQMIRDEMIVIDRDAMKGERIIISAEVQTQALEWLHSKHIGIVKQD